MCFGGKGTNTSPQLKDQWDALSPVACGCGDFRVGPLGGRLSGASAERQARAGRWCLRGCCEDHTFRLCGRNSAYKGDVALSPKRWVAALSGNRATFFLEKLENPLKKPGEGGRFSPALSCECPPHPVSCTSHCHSAHTGRVTSIQEVVPLGEETGRLPRD